MSTLSRPAAIPPRRRDFLWQLGGGLGGIALASLLKSEGLLASPRPAAAFCSSAAALTFPPGPNASSNYTCPARPVSAIPLITSRCLIKRHGQKWDPAKKSICSNPAPAARWPSPWPWKPYGQSGKMINDCVAPLGDCVDDMAFIHNMVSKSNVHGPATFMQATGFILPGLSQRRGVGELWAGKPER